MPMVRLSATERGFSRAVQISQAHVRLLFNTEPEQDYLAEFTATKQSAWPTIKCGIDDYIKSALQTMISDGVGASAALREFVSTDQFDQWLHVAVFNDVNYGLAVIGLAPSDCYVASAAGRTTDLRNDKFRKALRSCYDRMNPHAVRHNRLAERAGMHWLDGCVMHIAKSAYKIGQTLNT